MWGHRQIKNQLRSAFSPWFTFQKSIPVIVFSVLTHCKWNDRKIFEQEKRSFGRCACECKGHHFRDLDHVACGIMDKKRLFSMHITKFRTLTPKKIKNCIYRSMNPLTFFSTDNLISISSINTNGKLFDPNQVITTASAVVLNLLYKNTIPAVISELINGMTSNQS